VIFLVFLPPLIGAAAWQASPKELRRNAAAISVLAVGLVAVTMAGVAVVAHALAPGLTWAGAFVLGAVLAPTDTVAAVAVFRRIGVPERRPDSGPTDIGSPLREGESGTGSAHGFRRRRAIRSIPAAPGKYE